MKANPLLPATIMALSFAAPAFAEKTCCPKPCTPVCCPPIVEDCCLFNRCPPTQQVTPNAGPRVKNGWDFYGIVAFTYWTAHEDGLAFAMIQEDPEVGVNAPLTTVAIPDFDWKPGFQVGAGLNFCHDGWDVFLNYTWFHSMNNTNSLSVEVGDVADAFWLVNQPFLNDIISNPDSVFGNYEAVSAKWAVRLNVFDFELGRNFYISRRVTLRPHFGLKGMWERQALNLDLVDRNASGVVILTSAMDNRLKNWGIGIRAGIDTSWHFCESVSFLGELAVTGLWEQFKAHRTDQSTVFPGSPFGVPVGSLIGVNQQYNFYNLKPVIEWFLGFRWETWTCGEAFHFAIDAGWEQQIWFGQNQFLRIVALDADLGDLGLQGATLRFRMDF